MPTRNQLVGLLFLLFSIVMSTSENLEDWEFVDPSSLPHELREPPAKPDKDSGYLSSRNQLKTKVKRPLSPSARPQDSQVHQGDTSNPIRESMVARFVQAIEQAISSEAENPNSYREGVAAHKTVRAHPLEAGSKSCACRLMCATSSPELDGAVHCTLGWSCCPRERN